MSLSENFSTLFLLLSDDASLQNSLIASGRVSFTLCPPCSGRGRKGRGEEAVGTLESAAVGPQVSFFLRDYKGWVLYEAAEEWPLL